MTEDDAKTKWCPHVRIDSDDGGSMNRMVHHIKKWFGYSGSGNYPEESCNCIASECMMWVWDEEFKESPASASVRIKSISTTKGHCGLAK